VTVAGHYVALEEAYLRGCVAKARANNAINEVHPRPNPKPYILSPKPQTLRGCVAKARANNAINEAHHQP